jgi:anti-sigma factor RsiW
MLHKLPVCPKDADVFEHYLRGQLPAEAVDNFEEHVLVCDHCQTVVDEFDSFVAALRLLAPDRFQVVRHNDLRQPAIKSPSLRSPS